MENYSYTFSGLRTRMTDRVRAVQCVKPWHRTCNDSGFEEFGTDMRLTVRNMIKALGVSVLVVLMAQFPAVAQEGNAPDDAVQYASAAKKSGMRDAEIVKALVDKGWSESVAKSAVVAVGQAPISATNGTKAPTAELNAPSTIPPQTTTPVSTPKAEKQPKQKEVAGPTEGLATPGASNATATVFPPQGKSDAAPSGPTADEYRVGEGDVLQVSVYGEPTVSVGAVVVRPDGKISIPLLGDVAAAGMTPTQLAKSISEKLSDIIKNADVTVVMNQLNSKKIYIIGGVKKEGPIPYTYKMSILQAISEAGGLTEYAKRSKIYVLRNDNGKRVEFRFDYDAVLKGQHIETNIELIAGDTLVVPH